MHKRLASGLCVAPVLTSLTPELWRDITVRQEHPDSPHRDTECIFVRGPEKFTLTKLFMDIGSYDYPAKEQLEPALSALLDSVSCDTLHITELGRVLIVKLKAGGVVTEHVDRGLYADYYDRFHIVLSTNKNCISITGEESDHWAEGECWWFNHKLPHSAYNNGLTDRVHLIIDAVTS